TNLSASSQVVYGTESISDSDIERNDDSLGYQNNTVEMENDLDLHYVAVEDLEPGETYYFRPVSKRSGRMAIGEELSFTPQNVSEDAPKCSYLEDYLRIDLDNDPIEVLKLQVFLNEFEGIDTPVTGTFDQATYDSVVEFQERYFGKVLQPWGHTSGTGYVYITTKKLINEIVCQKDIDFTSGERSEMGRYKDFMESLDREGLTPPFTEDEVNTIQEGFDGDVEDFIKEEDTGTEGSDEEGDDEDDDEVEHEMEEIEVGLEEGEGEEEEEEEDEKEKSFLAGVGSAMFDFPSTFGEAIRNLVMLLLTISLIYLLTLLFIPMDGLENTVEGKSVRSKRAVLFSLITLIAILVSIAASVENLILPLVIIFVVSLIVAFFRMKNSERPINQELDLENN
ncbi:MAG: peptidoglycan-binding domain-containing protein, partial [Patescibacteria group bacterium]